MTLETQIGKMTDEISSGKMGDQRGHSENLKYK